MSGDNEYKLQHVFTFSLYFREKNIYFSSHRNYLSKLISRFFRHTRWWVCHLTHICEICINIECCRCFLREIKEYIIEETHSQTHIKILFVRIYNFFFRKLIVANESWNSKTFANKRGIISSRQENNNKTMFNLQWRVRIHEYKKIPHDQFLWMIFFQHTYWTYRAWWTPTNVYTSLTEEHLLSEMKIIFWHLFLKLQKILFAKINKYANIERENG